VRAVRVAPGARVPGRAPGAGRAELSRTTTALPLRRQSFCLVAEALLRLADRRVRIERRLLGRSAVIGVGSLLRD
jgi:hypothetical protein